MLGMRPSPAKHTPQPQLNHNPRAVQFAAAVAKASAGSVWPLCHARCCVLLLMVLCGIRAVAWHLGNVPGGTLWFIHMFSCMSDLITALVTLPLLICGDCGGVQGQCVKYGCVGPMMTMVVAMNLVDWCSLIAFFAYAAPRPLPADGRSYVDVLELVHPVWEFVLIASCALNFAACVSVWRVYREMRAAGLYPPNAKGATPREAVSAFEVICEAEDVALLAECSRARQKEIEEGCRCDARDRKHSAALRHGSQEEIILELQPDDSLAHLSHDSAP